MSDPKLPRDGSSEHLLIRLRQIVGEHDPRGQRWGVSAQPLADQQLTRQRVLEDLLRELLQPMIQRWLHENLESLVVSVVQEETVRRTPLSNEPHDESFAGMIVSLLQRKRRQ